MKFLNDNNAAMGAEDAEDIKQPTEVVEQKIVELQQKLTGLGFGADVEQRGELLLELGYEYLKLEAQDKNEEAFRIGRQAFNVFAPMENWEGAVQSCDVMFNANQPESLVALGNAVWLAVTFPIDPELTIMVLEHIVDETPPESDGAAVAAVTAHYITDLRVEDEKQRENLLFFTNQLLGKVARRHSEIQTQDQFDAWFDKMELNEPDRFLNRLGQVLNVMVQDDWWVDR
ncbi:hypothetical protein, partial [Candidatus Albibeggiatoa sp. nov. NOAA]|uniref:hypothetical protein n=1 Tax=Candidatus Albibeggiatoa sp. nov. NOAA TaxID=3162724 RepID=UPI0032F2C74D|nr:hypothetical protein [Thiotrichaceae bacterium]